MKTFVFDSNMPTGEMAAAHGRPVHVWADYVEPSALNQLVSMSKMPFLHPHGLAVMPDVHAGIGSTVGTVIATRKAIIPAAVGVDIGCGMNAVMTSLVATDLPDSLASLRHDIERGIPLGPGGAHRDEKWVLDGSRRSLLWSDMMNCVPLGVSVKNAGRQLGTLGSGNHFIELCLDEADRVWVMLHSGSRGIGNQIGRHFIELAKRDMERYYVTLPDVDLAYLPFDTPNFDAYWRAVQWAQEYALENRRQMMESVLNAMHHSIPVPFSLLNEAINCHHNYVELENHYGENVYVTRKGAIRARELDMGIIPGSMGTRSYIVRGKGNAASYHSCSHGAGRTMSRSEAKRTFTVEDLIEQTAGVECNKNASVIDEIPGAYKPIDEVMAQQADLVEIVHTLKGILCIKGS